METWKLIPDWPEYEVSSLGNVKRIVPAQGAKVGRILRPSIYPKTGYKYVMLQHRKHGKHMLIHRLVALAFLGKPPTQKHECNHINGIKLDNHFQNLEWVTHAQNGQHSYRMGMTKKPTTRHGEEVFGCSISTEIAQAILDAPQGYGTGKKLAEKFNTTKYVVSFIRRRRTWKHLTPTQEHIPAPSLPLPH